MHATTLPTWDQPGGHKHGGRCFFVIIFTNWFVFYLISDQDMVSKSADQVEAKVHQRPRVVGPTILLSHWVGSPRPSTNVRGRQTLVGTPVFLEAY